MLLLGIRTLDLNNLGTHFIKHHKLARQPWHMSLIPALRRQGLVDLCGSEGSLIYRECSRAARATQRSPVSKKTNKKPTNLSEFEQYLSTAFSIHRHS